VSLIAASVGASLAGYLLGSIPTGFLVAKAKGVDIRALGSGNIGATNVMRTLGKPAGIVVLLVDALKGFAAVWPLSTFLVDQLSRPDATGASADVVAVVAGLAAVLGHNYTCWLRFKGGKGIATTAGVLAALAPWALVIVLAVWLLSFALTRYVSVGSLGAAVALPVATWFTTQRPLLTGVTGVMSALAICKHKPNIQRLLSDTEHRFGARKDPEPLRPDQ
jgi:glycerol-3-phosphate acyltransferase PlsY